MRSKAYGAGSTTAWRVLMKGENPWNRLKESIGEPAEGGPGSDR